MNNARARRTDPATSHEAAASVTHLRDSQRSVLRLLHDAAEYGVPGMTDEALVAAYVYYEYEPRQSASGLRTRRRELVDAGHVFDTGRRDRLSTGRSAIVWSHRPGG